MKSICKKRIKIFPQFSCNNLRNAIEGLVKYFEALGNPNSEKKPIDFIKSLEEQRKKIATDKEQNATN